VKKITLIYKINILFVQHNFMDQINPGIFRSSRDHFFRIPHTKKGFLANFQLKRTYFDKNFWTHRSMTPKMTKNNQKKIFSPKVTNHLQIT
jgi:hypothetical protein